MQLRTILIIGLALVFGLSAAAGVNVFLRARALGATVTAAETVEVVVAAADIDRFTMATSENIITRAVPKDMVPKGAIRKADDAIGRVALHKQAQNEILRDSQLAPKGSRGGVGPTLPPGKRAFTIKTTKISGVVSGFVLPGDRVDVILTVTDPRAIRGAVTVTLLTNIEVLAVDQTTDPPHNSKLKVADLKSVTMLVTPKQAATLALGENKGHLHLSLRNHNDSVEVPITTVRIEDIPGLEMLRPQEEKKEEKKEPEKPAPKAEPSTYVPPLEIRIIRNTTESRQYLGPRPVPPTYSDQ